MRSLIITALAFFGASEIFLSSPAIAQTCSGSTGAGVDCVASGAWKYITAHTVCGRVENNHASGKAVIVPIDSATEWSSFRASPPTGVSVTACPDPFTWTGNTGDGLWSTAGNWFGGVVPGAANVAYFTNDCTGGNCNATMNVNVSVEGISMASTYTGTITQNSGITVTVDDTGWIQDGGTFTGSNANITIKRYLRINAGTFTSTSATLMLTHDFGCCSSTTDNFVLNGSATFNHNNGTLHLHATKSQTANVQTLDLDVSGLDLYNLVVEDKDTNSGGGYANTFMKVDAGSNIDVANDLTVIDGRFEGGNFRVIGDVYFLCASASSCAEGGGGWDGGIPARVEFVNGGSHTYTAEAGAKTWGFVINGGDTVSPAVGTTDVEIAGDFILNNGTFNAPSGSVTFNPVRRGCCTGSGILAFTGGTFNHNNAQYFLTGTDYNTGAGATIATIDVSAGLTLPNLTINHSVAYASRKYSWTGGGALTILGDFTFVSGRLENSSTPINVGGDFELQCATPGTSCVAYFRNGVNLNGAGTQNVTVATGSANPVGNWTVNKSSGTVMQLSDVTLNADANDLTLVTGNWDMNNFNLTVSNGSSTNNVLTIGAGTTLYQRCGTLTYESLVNNGTLIGNGNPTISIADASNTEGSQITFNVSLTEPVCGGPFTVNYSTLEYAAVAGTDFVAASGTLNIPAGATSGTMSVTTATDSIVELHETFFMILSSPSHGTISNAMVYGRIMDDDGTFIWTGAAGDNDWDNIGNWQNSSVPTSSDVAVFDNTCSGANCNVATSGNISARGIILRHNYTGTFTQSGADTINLGTNTFNTRNGWHQEGGSFVGGSGNIRADVMHLYGGTFTSSSGELRLGYNADFQSTSEGFTLAGIATFNHNNGRFFLDGEGNAASARRAFQFVLDQRLVLYDFDIDIEDQTDQGGYYDGRYAQIMGTVGIIEVHDEYNVWDGVLYDGDIEFYGADARFYCSTPTDRCAENQRSFINGLQDVSLNTLKFMGSGPQTYTFDDGARGPRFVIENLDGVSTTSLGTFNVNGLDINVGNFVAPSGTLEIFKRLHTHYMNNDAGIIVAAAGSFSHNNGTVHFKPHSIYHDIRRAGKIYSDLGNINFNNFILDLLGDSDQTDAGRDAYYVSIDDGQTLTVLNDYTVKDGLIRSSFNSDAKVIIRGNYIRECSDVTEDVCAGRDYFFNKVFDADGTVVTAAVGAEDDCEYCTFTVNAGTGTVTFQDSIRLTTVHSVNDFFVTSGILHLTGSANVYVGSDLVNNGAITCDGGSYLQYAGSVSGTPGGGNNPACYGP